MTAYYFQILDSSKVNDISRWAFGCAVNFYYPERLRVLYIELDSQQYLEFIQLFSADIQAL